VTLVEIFKSPDGKHEKNPSLSIISFLKIKNTRLSRRVKGKIFFFIKTFVEYFCNSKMIFI
jgi:hypothetical protein